MRFFIYKLNGCKVCTQREDSHSSIANLLEGVGIETIGVTYGHVDGQDYYPYTQHDRYCRNPNNASNYVAPVYILEDDNNIVKMADISGYTNANEYAQYVVGIARQLSQAQ